MKDFLPLSVKNILSRKSDLSNLNDCKELLRYLEQVVLFCIEFLGKDAVSLWLNSFQDTVFN